MRQFVDIFSKNILLFGSDPARHGGHVPDFGVSACPRILFLHFGVRNGTRDSIPREQQSDAVPKLAGPKSGPRLNITFGARDKCKMAAVLGVKKEIPVNAI